MLSVTTNDVFKKIAFSLFPLLTSKKINENVNFVVKNLNNETVEILTNQNLFQYWTFYISDVDLTDNFYIIEIIGTDSGVKLYNNLLKIKMNHYVKMLLNFSIIG